MKSLVIPLILSVGTALAVPTVSNVNVSQGGSGGPVKITYQLDAPAIVTIDVLTNGVSIGAEKLVGLTGDVNRLVPQAGEGRVTWRPYKTWPGDPIEGATVKVRAWAINEPPDYLVYDFVNHTTNFYTCVEALPDGGLANDVYRTDRIVLRKIPAKGVEWLMGCHGDEVGATDTAVEHQVVLTEDFYMAIYETTQAQYIHSGSTYAKNFAYEGEDAAVHPADNKVYWHLHGDWPTKGRKDPGGDMALFRKVSGIDFDLPTEAQWEFACRAGTRTMINTGHALTSTTADENMNAAAWSTANSKEGYDALSSHPVGRKLQNAWGLYDMHGNINEWCLDWHAAALSEDAVDPVGQTTGSNRVLRGGGFAYSGVSACTSSARSGANNAVKDRGFRMICPVTLKW